MSKTRDYRQWTKLVILNGRVEHQLAEVLQRSHSLGLSEYRALCHLSGAPAGELRMQQLADLTGLNQSSVSRLIQRLERGGLAKRSHCDNDRRGVHGVITNEGRKRQAEAYPTYLKALTEALNGAKQDTEMAGLVSGIRGESTGNSPSSAREAIRERLSSVDIFIRDGR